MNQQLGPLLYVISIWVLPAIVAGWAIRPTRIFPDDRPRRRKLPFTRSSFLMLVANINHKLCTKLRGLS